MSEEDDFMSELGAEAAVAPKDSGALEELRTLVAKVKALDDEVDGLDERATLLDAEKAEILRRQLPELMNRVGTPYLELDGKGFELTTYYKANIPEEHEGAAFAYLDSVDAGDLINRAIVIEFDREFEEEAKACERLVREKYQMAVVSTKLGVPWARLTSWVKSILTTPEHERDEVMRANPLPLVELGVDTYAFVKIDKPRPEGGKRKRRKKK